MATAPLTPEPHESPLLELDDAPPDDDQAAVAANIRSLMGRYRVSQQRLAGAVGLSTRGMSERLAGKTNFTIREVGRIARFFGKSLRDISTPMMLGVLMVVSSMDRSEDGFLDVTRIEHPLQLSLFDAQPCLPCATPVTLGTVPLDEVPTHRRAA